jgi:hypothetical protein
VQGAITRGVGKPQRIPDTFLWLFFMVKTSVRTKPPLVSCSAQVLSVPTIAAILSLYPF